MRVRPVWVAVVALLLSLVPSAAGGPADARVFPRYTFSAGSGGSILIHGAYPNVPSPCRFPVQPILHARYSGAIEVGKDDQGKLFVIGIVPFEDYLKGIGEVPRLWPMEALKAQVVRHGLLPGLHGARSGQRSVRRPLAPRRRSNA